MRERRIKIEDKGSKIISEFFFLVRSLVVELNVIVVSYRLIFFGIERF